MPRTYGDSFIHVSDIDAVVESSRPLCELKQPVVTDMHVAIARNVAGLIEDGAVLQTGIGGIPDAVLPFLTNRKDLGIHSELVSDGVIPLIEAGVITGARKNYKPRKIIVGFVLGTKKMFEFVDNNPIFEFHPTAYTNDPSLIARNDNMVAINSALQVDLTGQVCSDSIGNQFYSGIGGQVDFLRGASRSKGRETDHCNVVHGKERHNFADRSFPQSRRTCGHIAWTGSLCGHRARCCLSARQVDSRES